MWSALPYSPMAPWNPQGVLRTWPVPQLSLATTPTSSFNREVTSDYFLLEDAPPPPPTTRSTARSTGEVLQKLAGGESMPIRLLLRPGAAVLVATYGSNDAQFRPLTAEDRQVCERLQVLKEALQSARRDLGHEKHMHDDAVARVGARIDDLQAQLCCGTLPRVLSIGTNKYRGHGQPVVTNLVHALDCESALDAHLCTLCEPSF